MKAMVVTDASGRLLFCSPAQPASSADITYARQLRFSGCRRVVRFMIPAVCRWYALSGGWALIAERRAFREGIRLQAGVRFAAGEKTAVIAKDLR
ncbi:hypothetical protein AB0D66_32775, partial [Streptomyces sp. NPDC048270]